jgi:uncharacterized oligopeptide transporter (OPT) family protein
MYDDGSVVSIDNGTVVTTTSNTSSTSYSIFISSDFSCIDALFSRPDENLGLIIGLAVAIVILFGVILAWTCRERRRRLGTLQTRAQEKTSG